MTRIRKWLRWLWALITAISVLLAFVVLQTRFTIEAERPDIRGASRYAAALKIKNDGVFPVAGLKLHCEVNQIPPVGMEHGESLGYLEGGGLVRRVCNFGNSEEFREHLAVGRAVHVSLTYRPIFLFFKIPERYEPCRDFWFSAQPGEDGKTVWAPVSSNTSCWPYWDPHSVK